MNMNKIYIGFGILVLIILAIVGIYWQSQKVVITPAERDQKVVITPAEKELTAEEESLSQDITELQGIDEDHSLEGLEQDLSEAAEESLAVPTTKGNPTTKGKKIETASIESLESELSSELRSFSNDLNDLGGFESDTSLDMDTGLSSVIE
jgi:hypothetical protein